MYLHYPLSMLGSIILSNTFSLIVLNRQESLLLSKKSKIKESIKPSKLLIEGNNAKLESGLTKLSALIYILAKKDVELMKKTMKRANINSEVRCQSHHDFIISPQSCLSISHGVIGQKCIDLRLMLTGY